MKVKLHRIIYILMAMGLLIMSALPLANATADAGGPTVTINQAATQADPTNEAPIVFEVVFSEPVRYFGDAGDVDFTGSTRPGDLTYTVAPPLFRFQFYKHLHNKCIWYDGHW